MYQYVGAKLRERGKNKRLEDVNVSLMPLFDIFSAYHEGYFQLTHTLIQGPIYVSLQVLKASSLPFVNLPFEQWLAYINNRTLPALTEAPTIAEATIKYSDAFQSGYKVKRVHPTYAPDVIVPLAERTDLLLSKIGVDHEVLFANVMASVGGYWHFTIANATGLRVRDGGKVADRGKATAALMSFKDVGVVEPVRILPEMLAKQLSTIPYSQELLINMGRDLTGKSVLLVVGGYLHVNDIYDIVNYEEGVIKVNVQKINLLHRYYESKDTIDLSSLALSVASNNDTEVSIDELYSDAVIAAYFAVSQSFLVVVDTPALYVRKHLANKSVLPGIVEVSIPPIFPLATTYGRMPEYWRIPICEEYWEPTTYSLDIDENTRPNYVFETYRWQTAHGVVDSQLVANQPYDYSVCHLVEIGKQVVTY